jgi:organic radical activating enzyme
MTAKESPTLRLSRLPSGEPEIFYTLQGEGASIGTPTVFLRLSACNLTCSWCDTKYTWDWKNYDYTEEVDTRHLEDVEQRILRYDCPHLVITGGEPMLQQRNLAPLALSLQRQGFYIEVETNGTLAPVSEMIEAVSQWNVSPKLANSGNRPERREVPEAMQAFVSLNTTFFKFVIADASDVDEVCALIEKYAIPKQRVILMPEGTTVKAIQERAAWLSELCIEKGFRFTTRMHILLWGDKRGR